MTAPQPVPTSQPPVTAGQLVAAVPGVWETGAPEGAISWALSQVEDYCGRRFAKVTGDVIRVNPSDLVLLPDPPVIDVTRVEAFARPPYSFGAPAWSDLTEFGWTDTGELYNAAVVRWPATWPSLPRSLRVTYTHGFENWPQPVVDAVKYLAAQFLVNPTGMSEQRTADTLFKWYSGGATAGGRTLSGQPAGGPTIATGLDRLVLLEVG